MFDPSSNFRVFCQFLSRLICLAYRCDNVKLYYVDFRGNSIQPDALEVGKITVIAKPSNTIVRG